MHPGCHDLTVRIGISFEAIRGGGAGSWRVTWRIANSTLVPITVLEAWHPHGRFRSSRLRRSLRIPARGSALLELPARTDARLGETVENCFLILRVTARRERWRVLARFSVRLDDAGTPRLLVEAVDAHPAGR